MAKYHHLIIMFNYTNDGLKILRIDETDKCVTEMTIYENDEIIKMNNKELQFFDPENMYTILETEAPYIYDTDDDKSTYEINTKIEKKIKRHLDGMPLFDEFLVIDYNMTIGELAKRQPNENKVWVYKRYTEHTLEMLGYTNYMYKRTLLKLSKFKPNLKFGYVYESPHIFSTIDEWRKEYFDDSERHVNYSYKVPISLDYELYINNLNMEYKKEQKIIEDEKKAREELIEKERIEEEEKRRKIMEENAKKPPRQLTPYELKVLAVQQRKAEQNRRLMGKL
jgi:hypothetical protein